MANLIKSEEEMKDYLTNISTEYSFSCFKEKNAEGCHLLADFYEAVKSEFDSAAKLYQINCDDYKYVKSCVKFGNFSYLGRGTEQNMLKSLEYYTKACDLNSDEGCLKAGVMLTQEEKMEKDYVKGVAHLEKSCSLGNAQACYFASGLYITGVQGINRNMKKASEFSKLSCDGGHIYACLNLSQMYRKGDGVDKDEKKADELKQRAIEIKDDFFNKRKKSIGLQQFT